MASDLGTHPPDIDGLVFVSWLGHGRTSNVFLYVRQGTNGRVAVKVLHRPVPETTAHRITSDAAVLARLRHPGLVPVVAVGTTADGRPHLTAPTVARSSLADRLGGRAWPRPDVLDLSTRLGSALQASHDAGLLHGHLRPTQILFDAAGRPSLAWVGLYAKLAHPDDTGRRDPWTPPELWSSAARATPAADVYGLAAILWQLLTGQPPEPGGTPEALRPAIPGSLGPVGPLLAAALARDPADRPSLPQLLDGLRDRTPSAVASPPVLRDPSAETLDSLPRGSLGHAAEATRIRGAEKGPAVVPGPTPPEPAPRRNRLVLATAIAVATVVVAVVALGVAGSGLLGNLLPAATPASLVAVTPAGTPIQAPATSRSPAGGPSPAGSVVRAPAGPLPSVTTTMQNSGYAMEVKLELLPPLSGESLAQALTGTGTRLTTVCDSDPARDLVVPVLVTVVNRTPGSVVTPGFSLRTATTGSVGATKWGSNLTDGVRCHDLGDPLWHQWPEPLGYQGNRQKHVYVVFKGYFSPTTPQGDSSRLAGVSVAPRTTLTSERGGVTLTAPDDAASISLDRALR